MVSNGDSNEEIKSFSSNVEPKVKTRKVKMKTENSERTVKKRKAVKKSPEALEAESIGDKILDEDKLQNDFAKDFIKEE